MRLSIVKNLKLLGLLLLLATSLLKAEGPFNSSNLGLGVNLGSPNGISAKYWLNHRNAIDLAVGGNGYYLGNYYSGVNLHVDYLWHYYGVFGSPRTQAYDHLPLYIGIGAMASSPYVADDRGVLTPQGVIGVRGVAGLSWLFRNAPFDVFADLAPTLILVPNPAFIVDPEIGGRFYF
jgi:hypothetical protein